MHTRLWYWMTTLQGSTFHSVAVLCAWGTSSLVSPWKVWAGFLCSAFTIVSEFGFPWAWMLCERQSLLTMHTSARVFSTVPLGLWLQVMSGRWASSCSSQQWVTHSCKLSFSSKRLKRKGSAVLSSRLREKTSLHTLLRDLLGDTGTFYCLLDTVVFLVGLQWYCDKSQVEFSALAFKE